MGGKIEVNERGELTKSNYIIYTKGNGKEIYTPEVIFYSRCKQRAAYGFFLRASIENVYLVFSAPSKHDRLNIWKSFV